VVDDEPDIEALFRQHFRRDLRQGRFAMDFATSGPQALGRIAAAAGRDIILLLSDVNMPGMTGFDLLARIDVESGARDSFDAGDGAYLGEPVFVPHGAGETDGWLLSLKWDSRRNESALLVMDAGHLADGPVDDPHAGPNSRRLSLPLAARLICR
jgi:carotenoid cleavage dioxygenase-like enzyme